MYSPSGSGSMTIWTAFTHAMGQKYTMMIAAIVAIVFRRCVAILSRLRFILFFYTRSLSLDEFFHSFHIVFRTIDHRRDGRPLWFLKWEKKIISIHFFH